MALKPGYRISYRANGSWMTSAIAQIMRGGYLLSDGAIVLFDEVYPPF